MQESDFSFAKNKNKRSEGNNFPSSVALRKKPRKVIKTALIHILDVGFPLLSPTTGLPLDSVRLEPDRPYTIGRTNRSCDFLFDNRLVSKQHCQILFDSEYRKIYILDGAFVSRGFSFVSVVDEFRRRLLCANELEEEKEVLECSRVRVSLNGVFVNGDRIRNGIVRELFAGDEVLLVCGSAEACSFGTRIGFVIQGIVLKEEVVFVSNDKEVKRSTGLGTVTSSALSRGTLSSGTGSKRVFALREDNNLLSGFEVSRLKCGKVTKRVNFLLSHCTRILHSDDPISCIRQGAIPDYGLEFRYACSSKLVDLNVDNMEVPSKGQLEVDSVEAVYGKEKLLCDKGASKAHSSMLICKGTKAEASKAHSDAAVDNLPGFYICQKDCFEIPCDNDFPSVHLEASLLNSMGKQNASIGDIVSEDKSYLSSCPSPGKKFYLNRLEFMDQTLLGCHTVVSLPELIHPVGNIARMFIATFTSDILWFMSYCEIPCHLPVTIACHNTEGCWSSSPDRRSSVPYPSFPNLVVVYPPFPEVIAFGKDRKKQGIACHHPKLIVLQREDSIRIIITSANLVAKQWNNVTNTVWWQDFPRRDASDYSSLFTQVPDREINQGSTSDFAAQLAGFMASLVIDVPSQAHWIVELTKYNFEGATGHLIASIPGIHSYVTPHMPESMHFMPAHRCASRTCNTKFLGLIEASVVGFSHLFHSAADSNGAQLKKLAAFLRKSRKSAYGLLEIVLRRNTNVPADANAMSVLVPDPDEYHGADCIQLGFLPRNVAKWVSPLWDIGFFRFSGYVYCDEALEAAFGGNSRRVQLKLHVSQGPCFSDISNMIQPDTVVALCTLIASIQRCTGIGRLQEVLGQYKWPESQESDFIYGSSSVGSSINAQFLAAFSAAAGKRSLALSESEESDPEWGCWSASQELKSPSIRIIFPTIERVKNAQDGVLPSRQILCFSEKTWQRLRNWNILHDAVPHPHDRVGHPMHTKVARRRFHSRADESSFGWVYCGSHNFSPAAWGRPLSNPFHMKGNGSYTTTSSSGLRLHVCNYELGIIFVFPPPEVMPTDNKSSTSLDDILMPFVIPPPKYGPRDRPATAQAMREALAELTKQDREGLIEVEEMIEVTSDEEEEVIEVADYIAEEKEEEKAYAEILWSQVDSSQSC